MELLNLIVSQYLDFAEFQARTKKQPPTLNYGPPFSLSLLRDSACSAGKIRISVPFRKIRTGVGPQNTQNDAEGDGRSGKIVC
jgi:hypothetical protein